MSDPSHDLPPTWVEGAAGSGHDVDHLPLGVAAGVGPVARIGDHALPLGLATAGDLPGAADALAAAGVAGVLDPLLALGPPAWADLRATLQRLLTDPPSGPASSACCCPSPA